MEVGVAVEVGVESVEKEGTVVVLVVNEVLELEEA